MMTPNLIVSTAWLAEHLTDPNVRIVDIRGHVAPASDPLPHYFAHRADYDRSHIPGAVFIDWVRDITDPDSPNGTQIAQPDAFAALMNTLGIGDDTLVVAYDDAGGMFAARLWWALNYYGHEQIVVVDGGWQRWTAEGRPTTANVPQFPPANPPTTFTPRPNPAIRRTIEQVAEMVEAGSPALIDVRTPAEFNGQASRARRGGHILPRGELVNPDGTFPGAEQLRARFETAGINPAGIDPDEEEVVLYCNGGVSASYGLLALRAAGYKGGAVYDGSWKEWGNDETRPIE
jgi:thiosulfate/3-mercaptopyruvate sulfurtransferase